jgi:pSer/pThr/pTyr-binding forkhead associated (FHA) protein
LGKLVLYHADGSTLDIRLERERITIGRRADNDVCLPYPAVSGEHAAVVTILSDSFLEDLGSTNGTLVNGKPIAKHFLRDRDQIDIGRQRLVYLADEAVALANGPQAQGRQEAQLFGERAAPARTAPDVVVPEAGSGEPAPSDEPAPAGNSTVDIERFVAAEIGAGRSRASSTGARIDAAPVPGSSPQPQSAIPAIRVLTGPNAGREIVLDRDETTVGRVGLQVAAVRRADGVYRLLPLEGSAMPSLNGAPVTAEGAPLKAGDLLEVAGVRLEFVLPASDAAA